MMPTKQECRRKLNATLRYHSRSCLGEAMESKLELHIQPQTSITTLPNEMHYYYTIQSLGYKYKCAILHNHHIRKETLTSSLRCKYALIWLPLKWKTKHPQSLLWWKNDKTEKWSVKNRQESPQPSSTLKDLKPVTNTAMPK